jgi:hypothetical protein
MLFRKYKIVKFLTFLFFICLWYTSNGQTKNKFSLNGSLIDSITKQPIEYASIAIYKQIDNSLVTGTFTNPKGQFIINDLLPAKYLIKCSFMGYKIKTVPIEIVNSSLNIFSFNGILYCHSLSNIMKC